MIKVINKFLKHEYYQKSIAILIFGSIGAQFLTLIISPILTRIFSPEDFGLFTILSTAAIMFGPILSLRYENSIVMEEDQNSVYALVIICVLICFCLGTVISFGFFFYIKNSQFTGINPLLGSFLIFLSCLFSGILNILTAYNNRLKEYKLIASVYFIRVSVQNVLNILFGVLNTGGLGLMVSQIASNLVGVRRQSQSLLTKLSEFRNVKSALIISILRRYKRMVIWSSPAAFLNSFSYSSINYFIQFLFGLKILGYYSQSYRLLALPMIVVSANISKVFFEKGSREMNESGSFLKSFDETLRLLILIAIPMLIIMILFAPWIFGFVFGENWRVAGEYVQILAPMFILRFIAGGVVFSATIAEKQNIDFIMQVCLVSINLICYFLTSVLKFDVNIYLLIINIFSSIVYTVYIFLLRGCAKGKLVRSI